MNRRKYRCDGGSFPNADLLRTEFKVNRCNWIPFEEPPEVFEALVKIRHNHPGAIAEVRRGPNDTASVTLKVPQRAITPGQAAVFYQDDVVMGGGWITGG